MKQIFCLLSLFAVTYAQKGRGIKIRSDSARIAFGKKQDVSIARKPDGGLLLKAKYVEVNALRVNGKSLEDYVAMAAKKLLNGGSGPTKKPTKKPKCPVVKMIKCKCGVTFTMVKGCKIAKCRTTCPDQNLSGGNIGGAKNLKACKGECDADSQCAKGLKCFQRSKGEKIPGCKGKGGGADWDYCYNPLHGGIKELGGPNNSKAKNLQRCVGECDADSQCAYGLKCFQRSKGEKIPGCKDGKKKVPGDYDYCYDPKIEVKKPTKKPANPCLKNNGGCDKARKCMNVKGKAKCGNCPKGYTNLGATKCKKAAPAGDKNLGGGNNGAAKNLKACFGECDKDSQCAKGLKCFQRSKGEKIPGCKGKGGGGDWDYCYNPLHGGIKTLSGGNNGKAKNLQRCVGECDADSQCAYGLKCFQRSKGEKIPGCKGAGNGKDWDYCYDPKTR